MKRLRFRKILAVWGILSMSSHAAIPVAHEWGTFTSVINKEGKQLQGLHHEEEALPNFVYDLARLERFGSGGSSVSLASAQGLPPIGPPTRGFAPPSMDLMPVPVFTEKITQKMETPVIYFYTKEEQDVQVKVDFPSGVISQWFPNVSKINPGEEAKNGFATWDVKVLKTTDGTLPATSGNSIWNPSRKTKANLVKVNNEVEKLIFYRGLGDFKTPIQIMESENIVTIVNNSAQVIKGLTLLNYRYDTFRYHHIHELGAYAKVSVNLVKKRGPHAPLVFENYNSYLNHAKSTIVRDLVKSGLFKDESEAMVNTWEGGYFKTQGVRLLYVLPKEWTEEILPLKITPTPKELVRTLVGRVEILTNVDDNMIKEFVNDHIVNGHLPQMNINGVKMTSLGHFPEPKLRRALELNFSDEVKEKIKKIIETMNTGLLN